MKNTIAWGLALICLFSVCGEASQRRARRHRRRDHVEHVTELDQLGRIAILLKTRVDQPGFQAKKNDYACSLSPKSAESFLRAVHAEIDTKVESEAKARNEMRHRAGNEAQKFSDSDWRDCAHSCTCFIYQDILAKAEPKVLTEYDIMSRDYFQKQTTNLDEVQSMSCARQVKNFCGTATYRRLKTEAAGMTVDDGPEEKRGDGKSDIKNEPKGDAKTDPKSDAKSENSETKPAVPMKSSED